MSKPNTVNGAEYPTDPMGWLEEMITGMQAALAFLGWCVFTRRLMIDTAVGFVSDDNEPTFTNKEGEPTFDLPTANHLQGVLERVIAVLRGEGYDAEDVVHQYFERAMMAEAEGFKGSSIGMDLALAIHSEIKENRDNAEHEAKREAQRWLKSIVKMLKEMGCPVHEGPDGTIAIPQGVLPEPVESVLRDAVKTLGGSQGVGVLRKGESIDEALGRAVDEAAADAALEETEGIDLDSDDNDDDPFGFDEGVSA